MAGTGKVTQVLGNVVDVEFTSIDSAAGHQHRTAHDAGRAPTARLTN